MRAPAGNVIGTVRDGEPEFKMMVVGAEIVGSRIEPVVTTKVTVIFSPPANSPAGVENVAWTTVGTSSVSPIQGKISSLEHSI